jgi:hypothetical protein
MSPEAIVVAALSLVLVPGAMIAFVLYLHNRDMKVIDARRRQHPAE